MILNLAIGYICAYIGFLVLLSLSKMYISRNTVIKMSVFLVASLIILAYHTTDNSWEGDDLGRYLLSMNMYREKGISYAFNHGLWKYTPLSTLEMYLFSLTGNNQLLLAFNALVIWTIYFYIIIDSMDNKIKIRKFFFIIIMLFSFNNIYSTISNIRYPLATAIVVLAIYLDLTKKQHIAPILLYIAGCLIHSNMILILVIRIIFNLKIIKRHQWLLLFVIFSLYGVVVNNLVSNGNPFFQYLGDKAEMYGYIDARYGFLYYLQSVVGLIGVILITWGVYINRNNNDDDKNDFLKAMSAMEIAFLFLANHVSFRCVSIHSNSLIPDICVKELEKKDYIYKIGLFLIVFSSIFKLYYFYKNNILNWTLI